MGTLKKQCCGGPLMEVVHYWLPSTFECIFNRKYKIAWMTFLRFVCGNALAGRPKSAVNGQRDIVSVNPRQQGLCRCSQS